MKNASKEKATPRWGDIGREGYRPHGPCFTGYSVCITVPTHIHLDRQVCVLVSWKLPYVRQSHRFILERKDEMVAMASWGQCHYKRSQAQGGERGQDRSKEGKPVIT